ncbi:MAG: M48 family metallopeptidase [Pseudomonadota bacterium]
MTALADYTKLEAEARYFDGQSAAPVDVVLSFGGRSLVIVGLDDRPIAHWPLATLRSLADPVETTVQLVPDHGSDERVVLQDREMIQAISKVCPKLYRRPVDKPVLRRAAFWTVGAIGSVLLMLLVLIPTLANQLAEYIPPEREQALGDAVAEQLGDLLALQTSERPALCTEPAGTAALTRMTRRVTPEDELPYPLRVNVIDHKLVNAVALPGGRILIFRGLIENAKSPEEVAGVLAHEIGHVVNRDPTRGVLRAAGTAGIIGLLLGDIFGATVIAAASDAVLNASHQRDAETQADEMAYRLLGNAGLPATPLSDFFDRLREEHGDATGPFRYLSSHPDLSGRAARALAADRIGKGTFIPVLVDRDWLALQNICDEDTAFENITSRPY